MHDLPPAVVWTFQPARLWRWLFSSRPETDEETALRAQVSDLKAELAAVKEALEVARSSLMVREREVELLAAVCERDRLRVRMEQELLGRRSMERTA